MDGPRRRAGLKPGHSPLPSGVRMEVRDVGFDAVGGLPGSLPFMVANRSFAQLVTVTDPFMPIRS